MDEREIRKELKSLKTDVSILNARIQQLESKLNMNESLDEKTIILNKESKAKFARKVSIDNTDKKSKSFEIPVINSKQKSGARGQSNLEANIGKNLMAVFASILIFIGLSSLLVLVFNDIPEVVKLLLCYVVVFAIFGFSLYKVCKNKNSFILAINSCSVGSVYILLLLTRFYFGYINDIFLFVLLILWSAFVYLLSRKVNAVIYTFISYIGIYFSITLVLFSTYFNVYTLILLSVFYIVISKLYSEKLYIGEKFKVLFYVLEFIQLSIFVGCIPFLYDWDFGYDVFINVLLGINSILLIINNMITIKNILKKVQSNNGVSRLSWFTLFTLYSFVLSMLLCSYMIKDANIILFIFPLLYIGYLYYLGVQKYNIKWLLVSILYLTSCVFGWFISSYELSSALLLLSIIAFYFYGIRYKDIEITHISLLGFALSLPWIVGFNAGNIYWINLSIVLSVYVVIFFVFISQHKINWRVNLILFYFIELFAICVNTIAFIHTVSRITSIKSLYDLNLWAIVCSVYILLMSRLKQFKTQPLKVIHYVMNYIFMFISIILVYSLESHFVPRTLFLLLSVIQCFNFILYDARGRRGNIGYYIGIKSTAFISLILKAYLYDYKVGYIYSILYIILAILFILYGFNKQYKEFRIYGLLLSMIGICKLLVIDINYDNSISRILSFIGAGILCFMIVFIYNKFDKESAS